MTVADISCVVKIHQQAFHGFFLEQMGPSFIKAYYSIVLAYAGSIAHVYIGKDGLIEGFAVGFADPRAFYKKLKRSSLKLIFPILFGVIQNPGLFVRMLQNVRRVSGSKHIDWQFAIDEKTAELSSIAVGSAAKGTGSLLIDAFIKDAWSRSLVDITLTTDYEDNELVNKFYIKHGFKRIGVEVRKGRRLLRYLLIKG